MNAILLNSYGYIENLYSVMFIAGCSASHAEKNLKPKIQYEMHIKNDLKVYTSNSKIYYFASCISEMMLELMME